MVHLLVLQVEHTEKEQLLCHKHERPQQWRIKRLQHSEAQCMSCQTAQNE